MTVSSAEPAELAVRHRLRRFRGLAAIAAFALASAALFPVVPGAGAQPLQLKRAAPPELAPEAPAENPAEPAGESIPQRPLDKDAIVVNSLDAVNVDAVGLIGPAEGGFETTLWQGTSWATVSSLMPRMPETSTSSTIRSLSSRLLLSRGVVPEGKPEDASFVRLRVDRLLAMGDVANALALLKVVPEERRDEPFARAEVEALFLDGRQADACGRVAALVASHQGAYWRQAQAFCLALDGEHARAALIADLMRERSADVPPVFFTAIERMSGLQNKDVALPRSPTGLALSMALAAGFELSPLILRNARPAIVRLLALSPRTAPEMRLEAIERAQAVGALGGDEAINLYQAFPFPENELRHPITTAESDWNARVRALLIRAAANQPVSLGKAEVLRRAWQLGAERGGLAETLRASLPVVSAMEPNVALTGFAAEAARALFAGGRVVEAMAWYALVAADSDRLPEMKQAADALWPIALLADADEAVAWEPERLEVWYDAQRQRDPENALRRALTYFSMLEALGREVPAELWRKLLDGPLVSLEPALNRAWSRGLLAAADGGRIGEAVLLVVTGAAATGDRVFSSNAAGYEAVAALRRAGLDAEARRLAVETVMAAGL